MHVNLGDLVPMVPIFGGGGSGTFGQAAPPPVGAAPGAWGNVPDLEVRQPSNPYGVYPSTAPTHPSVSRPNHFDQTLDKERALFSAIAAHGGLQKICCPANAKHSKPPYLVMPVDGRQYQEIDSIPLPAAGSGNTLVASFKVPTGYDGVITSITNFWTGTTFVEGSGDLIWRLNIGRVWARNLGSISTTLGSLSSPCPLFRGGIRVYSQQEIGYYIDHALTSSLTGGRIVCGVFGWFYPI